MISSSFMLSKFTGIAKIQYDYVILVNEGSNLLKDKMKIVPFDSMDVTAVNKSTFEVLN